MHRKMSGVSEIGDRQESEAKEEREVINCQKVEWPLA